MRPEASNSANAERNREAARKSSTPTVKPQPGVEPRREEAVSRGRDVQPVEKPAATAKPATHPATASQRREELKARTNPEKPAAPAPPAVAAKPVATPAVEPAQQPQVAPNGKSRAAERAEANKKKKEDREQKQKSDEQEARDSKGQPR